MDHRWKINTEIDFYVVASGSSDKLWNNKRKQMISLDKFPGYSARKHGGNITYLYIKRYKGCLDHIYIILGYVSNIVSFCIIFIIELLVYNTNNHLLMMINSII